METGPKLHQRRLTFRQKYPWCSQGSFRRVYIIGTVREISHEHLSERLFMPEKLTEKHLDSKHNWLFVMPAKYVWGVYT